jgi:hypothetical protein
MFPAQKRVPYPGPENGPALHSKKYSPIVSECFLECKCGSFSGPVYGTPKLRYFLRRGRGACCVPVRVPACVPRPARHEANNNGCRANACSNDWVRGVLTDVKRAFTDKTLMPVRDTCSTAVQRTMRALSCSAGSGVSRPGPCEASRRCSCNVDTGAPPRCRCALPRVPTVSGNTQPARGLDTLIWTWPCVRHAQGNCAQDCMLRRARINEQGAAC